jgi:hypothetical protein
MKALIQAAFLLLGAELMFAQNQATGIISTNREAAPAQEELRLSLPKVGIELTPPGTPSARPPATAEPAAVIEMFQPSAQVFQQSDDVATEKSATEADKPVMVISPGVLAMERQRDVAQAGGMTVSGPLVFIFNGAKPVELPKRFLSLINPFAAVEDNEEEPSVPGQHPRAWTTQVGWNPGGSAFPDPRTHVPTLDFLSIFSAQ